MISTDCTNCGAGIVADEPNVCMMCGEPLCEHCYDESPYCKSCDEQEVRSGECVECGRSVTRLNRAGVCEGCFLEAAMLSGDCLE
jgi:hypothetical protein